MYENIYSYNEEVNGKFVWMIFKPNFREEITLFSGKEKILSDGKVTMVGELEPRSSKYQDVFVSENAQWALEDEGYSYTLFVTERTKEIITPLGEEWNKEFNRILQKCKKDYYDKKKKEMRLYFYDVSKEQLKLCYLGDSVKSPENFEYDLNRYFVPYCAIDKKYTKPEKDVFILGRVAKTIGTKNSKLMDFVEPVFQVKLDFEKEKLELGEYADNISKLEEILYTLLAFTTKKQHSPLEIARIQAYLKSKVEEPKFIESQFMINVMDAFNEGNATKLRELYNVLIETQDCTNIKFKLKLKKEVVCRETTRLDVFFENQEVGYLTANWIYKNIQNCTDAKGEFLGIGKDYLGVVENRYKFE